MKGEQIAVDLRAMLEFRDYAKIQDNRETLAAALELVEEQDDIRNHLHMAAACCNSGNKEKCIVHIDSAIEHLRTA